MLINMKHAIVTRAEVSRKNPAVAYVDVTERLDDGRTGECSFSCEAAFVAQLAPVLLTPVGIEAQVRPMKFGRDLALRITNLSIKKLA